MTARNSQALQGEDENWKAEYRIDFATDYLQKDGKVYPKSMNQKRITVTYKKNLSDLFDVKHLEISYEDSFGGGGKLIEDFDSPPTEKQFRLGGGSGSGWDGWTTTESYGYHGDPEHLQDTIMIFSGPSAEIRNNAAVTVDINIDGKIDTLQLSPDKEPAPFRPILEQVKDKLSKRPFLKTFSGHASDLSLKLESYDVRLDPAAIHYNFTVRNEGRKTLIGRIDELEMKVVPGDRLKEASQGAVGRNIFDPNSGFGYGVSTEGDIFNHEDCSIDLSYDLIEESAGTAPATASAEEELAKLLSSASDCSLIISYKGEEAARFDLRAHKPGKQ